MKLSVYSDFDAVLSVDGKSFVLNKKQQRLEFEFEEEKELACFVYPVSDKSLPFGFKVEKENNALVCKSPNVVLYQVADGCFEIALKKFGLGGFGLKKVFSKDIEGFSLMVLQSGTSLFVVKENDEIHTYEIESTFKELAFDVVEKVPFFVASKKEGKFVCIFCPFSGNFFAFNAKNVKIEENKIEIIEDLFSHSGHGKKTNILLQEGRVVVEGDELLYLNHNPEKISSIKVVPFAFFESVKLKDFNLAKSYLSSGLRASLSDDVLQEYFGDFEEVVPNNYSSDVGLVVSVLAKTACKVFSFSFEGGKIRDINLLKEYIIKNGKKEGH